MNTSKEKKQKNTALELLKKFPEFAIDKLVLPKGVNTDRCKLYLKLSRVYSAVDLLKVANGEINVRYIGPKKKGILQRYLAELWLEDPKFRKAVKFSDK